ncbi:unnamed protein product [Chilo suppressalis]|uniref:Uncharacterized protein n=1 Tax=Chilo suppressalis TaxID=168631 RepID=A0ABN8EB29_CHISP|nr:unnamed protein product [Chilo suppressalis]
MYNWRLLLFAFFAVFQTIASFEERNLVDGRQQCCDHRFSRDTGSRNENSPFKLLSKDRTLKFRQNLQEVRRDDVRNEQRTPLKHFPTDQFRNAQEQNLIRGNPDIRIHSSRATFRGEIRATRIRDIKPDSERNFARENLSRSSRGRTSGNDIRPSENLLKYRERQNNQRETRRRMINDVSENRRIFTEVRQRDFRGTNEHYIERSYSPSQNVRRSLLERGSERNAIREVSVTRDNSRKQHLQRSARSLDRFTKNIEEQMRISSESFRVADDGRQIRSRYREVRNERERTEVRLTSPFHDREHLYRKSIVLRDIRVTNEVRNNDSDERRIVRDNVERISPRVIVEFRRFDVNVSPIRNSRERTENRETTKVVSRLIEDRRERVNTARRILNIRRDNRLNEIKRERTVNNRDINRRESRNERSSATLRSVRIPSRHFEYERRTVAPKRENTRTFEGIKQQERRDVNERVRSSEQEHFTHAAHSRIISMWANRKQEAERKVDIEKRVRQRGTSQLNQISSQKTDARDATYSKGSRDDYRASDSRRSVEYRLKSASERMTHEMKEGEIQIIGLNWQYLLYTVQAIYLCSVLLPMLMNKAGTKKKTLTFDWGTPLQKLIKVD